MVNQCHEINYKERQIFRVEHDWRQLIDRLRARSLVTNTKATLRV